MGLGITAQSSQPPAAKFASQGDSQMRTDTQIKFLYYPLLIKFSSYNDRHISKDLMIPLV